MLKKDVIHTIIFQALKHINEERAPAEQLKIDVNTRLFGADAELDSLSLVSIIVDVENDISELVGHEISLTDDRAMSQKVSPFSDVNSLTAYIELLTAQAS
jgi:acyl carrier protein